MFSFHFFTVGILTALALLVAPASGAPDTSGRSGKKSGSDTSASTSTAVQPAVSGGDTGDDGIAIISDPWFAANAKLSKHFDDESKTTYYLTRINHRDTNGKLIKLHMEISYKAKGETVREFAVRKNTDIAINASMGLSKLPDGRRQPVGIQIIDGVIKQALSKKSYTLGIKEDNELVYYPPGSTASDILKGGSTTALTAFSPLIVDHEITSMELFKNNSTTKHPRQVVAQYDNKDILFFSCGGRGYDGEGMTVSELQRVLKALNVRFAFNLDGGGSVSTIIGDQNINKKIDGKGTLERLRPNFLYVTRN